MQGFFKVSRDDHLLLKLSSGAAASPSDAPPEPPPTTDPPPGLSPDQLSQMGAILQLLSAHQPADEQTTALLTALRPFLREKRQKKLDQAMRMAGLTHAVRQLFHLWKEGNLHV